MNNTFEANFNTTGSPTIKIYKVVGENYELVKTDTMTATPETGKYSYKYKELSELLDYSARMTLGSETQNAVYNGIFATILNRTVERGGGGGGSFKMSKAELERIVEEMGLLLRDSLSQIEISLPDGLGETEIAGAVSRMEKVGAEMVGKIAEISASQEEAIKNWKVGTDTKDLGPKIDKILADQSDISGSMKDAIIKELSAEISGQDEKFKTISVLLAAFRKEQKKEAKEFARLIAAFRNEIKK